MLFLICTRLKEIIKIIAVNQTHLFKEWSIKFNIEKKYSCCNANKLATLIIYQTMHIDILAYSIWKLSVKAEYKTLFLPSSPKKPFFFKKRFKKKNIKRQQIVWSMLKEKKRFSFSLPTRLLWWLLLWHVCWQRNTCLLS